MLHERALAGAHWPPCHKTRRSTLTKDGVRAQRGQMMQVCDVNAEIHITRSLPKQLLPSSSPQPLTESTGPLTESSGRCCTNGLCRGPTASQQLDTPEQAATIETRCERQPSISDGASRTPDGAERAALRDKTGLPPDLLRSAKR